LNPLTKTEVRLESGHIFIARESPEEIKGMAEQFTEEALDAQITLTDDANGQPINVLLTDVIYVSALVASSADLPNSSQPGGSR
jgi:hypothetical protein